MTPAALQDDIEALAAQNPALWPLVQQLREAPALDAPLLRRLADACTAARLGPYRTLALLLKAEWQSGAATARRWCPWEDAVRFSACLSAADGAPIDFEVLVLEQCALSCHLLSQDQVAALAERHARACALLAQADAPERRAFIDDQRSWLYDELQLDELLGVRQQLVAELEGTRMQYLQIAGPAAIGMVEAAHRLALMRYRVALNDPTLTEEELDARLAADLARSGADAGIVCLEPDLRLALLDTVQGMHGDHQSLRRLAQLWSQGHAQPASEEDRRNAAMLFRKLARLIHPDALAQREGYAAITPQNRLRLKEIWYEASATHGTRVHLSHDKLVDYEKHLLEWIAEAQRIVRSLSFHSPSRLLAVDSYEAMRTDLQRARLDVERLLHAVRDDIARLEFDPQHAEYRRIIAMDEAQREAECERMRARAEQWASEADRLSAQLATGVADAAHSDATSLKGKPT